jgi:hypothetical protein
MSINIYIYIYAFVYVLFGFVLENMSHLMSCESSILGTHTGNKIKFSQDV